MCQPKTRQKQGVEKRSDLIEPCVRTSGDTEKGKSLVFNYRVLSGEAWRRAPAASAFPGLSGLEDRRCFFLWCNLKLTGSHCPKGAHPFTAICLKLCWKHSVQISYLHWPNRCYYAKAPCIQGWGAYLWLTCTPHQARKEAWLHWWRWHYLIQNRICSRRHWENRPRIIFM